MRQQPYLARISFFWQRRRHRRQPVFIAQLGKDNIWETIVDIRTVMSKANIPNDGKRYLLVTPDTYALVLKWCACRVLTHPLVIYKLTK